MIRVPCVLRLLAPLFLLFLAGCAALLPGSGEPARTSSETERAQAYALIDQAKTSLALASVWLEPAAVAKGQRTLDALRKVAEASEFVPVTWSTITGTALQLATIWLLPPPPAEPAPTAAPPG